jgi:uncharacterized membrane protein YphA (DoxX/SURF4 family)
MASNSPRLNIPALGGIYATLSPYAELLLRGGLGAILIVHALQKFLSWFGGSGMGILIGLLQKFGIRHQWNLAISSPSLSYRVGFSC